MHKQLPALLLTALMVWSLAFPAMGASRFLDVPQDHWAYEAISYLAEAGLVEGYPDGTFGGSRTFTRYEMALVFARIVARFEQHVDQLVARGIETSHEELVSQVSAALEEAAQALAAAQEAKASAAAAMDVAIGTLDAIDTSLPVSGDGVSAGSVVSRAQAALQAAQQAEQVAGEARDIAIGILDAIDARGWDAALDEIGSEVRDLADQVVLSHDAAQKAQDLAQQAIDVALGTLDAIDARGWDEDIAAVSEQADEAIRQARAALDAAQVAQNAAQEALDAAIAVLDVIDSRDWDVRIADAEDKAQRALALAQQIAAEPEAEDASLFSAEARAAIEEIAAAVVTERLRAIEENAAAIAGDVEGLRADVDAAEALIKAEAARLEKAIADLTVEFSREFELLGIRVDALEAKFMALDDTVRAVQDRLDRVRVSGSNEVRISHGYHSGDTPYEDPRDPDEEFEVPDNVAENRLRVRLDSKLQENVDLTAEMELVIDQTLLSSGSLKPVFEKSQAYVELETDRPIRVVRLGTLDPERVATGFLPYLIDAEEFGTDNYGFFANIASGSTTTDVFGAKAATSGTNTVGAAMHIPLGENMELSATAVHHWKGTDERTAVGLAGSGDFTDLKYEGFWAKDVQEDSLAYSAQIVVPIEKVTFSSHFDRIDEAWSEARRLPFSFEADLREEDTYLDRPSAVNEAIFAGERVVRFRLETPFGTGTAFVQSGQAEFLDRQTDPILDEIVGTTVMDRFSQYGVTDLELLGFEVDILRSRFVDWDDESKVMTDQRINLSTQVENIDLDIAIHNQKNKQLPNTDPEYDQRHFLVSVSSPITIFLPWTGTLAFGTSFTADNSAHSAYKLALEDYEAAPGITVNAEISAQNNRIDDGEWRRNQNWSGHKETVRAIDATWDFAEPMNLFGGYKVVNNEDGRTTTSDAGVEYKISAFGGDVAFGYGYRVVRNDGNVSGKPRNLISAAYTRTAGDFTLDADAKYYMGGDEEEKGNDYDTVASVRLVYPVFSGADFSLTGKYVHSRGDKVVNGEARPEYKASSLIAGFKFHF